MKNPPLTLVDCGIVTPLGVGKAAVAAALFDVTTNRLSSREGLIPDRVVQVGAVVDDIPALPKPLLAWDSKNNRMMRIALDEIRPSIDEAIVRYGRERIAIILGTSTSGVSEGEYAVERFLEYGSWPASFCYNRQETSSLSQFASSYLNITGPSYTIATACSSSAKVFASARRLINAGIVDAAIVGGTDTLCRMTLNGFNALGLLSEKRCNPFSANRDGISIGEGAAAFLLSKENGPIKLLGVGETSDAHHLTAPDPDGAGAYAAMSAALGDASLDPSSIAYINLHGTATPLNDAMEARAVAHLFGGATPCSSTKGMTGHMLGATGGCEAAFLWLTLSTHFNSGLLPPHVWDGAVDPALPALHFVQPHEALPSQSSVAMLTNSFGFGGNNVSLILGRTPS